jgi:hypothetical protein
LTDLEALRGLAERTDAADDLVSRNDRIARKPPLVIHDRNVGVAEPAVLHRNFDLIGTERAGVIFIGLEFLVRPRNGPGIDLHARFLAFA